MAGSNPLQIISGWLTDATDAIGDAISTATSGINDVFSPIETSIDDLASEFGTGISAVMSDVGTVASDIENVGATFGNAIGAAVSGLASEAATGLTSIENATANAVTSLGSSIVQGMGTAIQDDLGGALSAVESNVVTFVKDYGHAIIDVAANAVMPGSSLLIDLVWDMVQTGGLPSLQGLAEDAAESAVGELMPGMDEAIADAMPDLLGDVVSGAANNALTTFAGDVSTGDSSSQILSDLEKNATTGALAGVYGDATANAEDSVESLFDGSGTLSITDLASNFEVISEGVGSASELLISASALLDMTPTELLALGASDAGLPDITDIGGIDPSSILTVDLAQGLAIQSAGLSFSSGTFAEIEDNTDSIENLSTSTLGILRSIGVEEIDALDGGLSLDVAQALAIVADNLQITDTAQGSSRSSGVTLLCDQASFNELTATQLTALNSAGFINVSISDVVYVQWSLGQALAFAQSGLALGPENTAIYDATTAELTSLGQGTGTLTATDLQIMTQSGVSAVRVSGTAASMLNIPAAAFTLLSQAGLSDITYAVTDTAKALTALTSAQVQQVVTDFSSITWNISDSAADILSLTPANIATLKTLGVSSITCLDTSAKIDALTAAQIASLAKNGATLLQSTNGDITITVAQEVALQSAGLQIAASISSKVTMTDTGPHLATLTPADINALNPLGITAVVSTSAATALNSSQLLSLVALGVTLALPKGGILTDLDSAANLLALDNQQIQLLSAIGVSKFQVTDKPIAFTLGQFFAISAAGITLSDAKGAISAAATSFDLNALTVDQISKLAGLSITQIAVTGGAVTLSASVVIALEQAKIKLSGAAVASCVAMDSSLGNGLLSLTAAQILNLPQIGITTIELSAGSILSISEVEAIIAAKLNVKVAPGSGSSNANYTFAVSDTATAISALTATQLASFNAIGVDGLLPFGGTVDFTVAQIEQIAYLGVPQGTKVIVEDTAQNVNGNWNFLNQLRSSGEIAGVIVSGQKSPSTDTPVLFTGAPGGPAASAGTSLPFSAMGLTGGTLVNGTAANPWIAITIQILNSLGRPTDALGTLQGLTLVRTGTGSYRLPATYLKSAIAELQALQFAPTAAPGSSVSVTMSLLVSDGILSTSENVTLRAAQPGFVMTTSPVLFPLRTASTLLVSDGQTVTKVAGTTMPSGVVPLGAEAAYVDAIPGSTSETGVWITDGATSGSIMLTVPDTTPASFSPTIAAIPFVTTTPADIALINGTNAEGKAAIWFTNGTSLGTTELNIPGITGETGSDLVALGSSWLFVTSSASGAQQVWVTGDGFKTFHEVLSLSSSTTSIEVALQGQNAVLTTSAGVYAYNPTTQSTTLVSSSDASEYLTGLGSRAVWAASASNSASTTTPIGLWYTNGTAAGTGYFQAAGASTSGNGLDPTYITSFGSEALFSGMDAKGQDTIWVTDGTVAGTSELLVNQAGTLTPVNSTGEIAAFGNKALFVDTDTSGNPRLWITNGNSAGTTNLLTESGVGGIPHEHFAITLLSAIGSQYYFTVVNSFPGDPSADHTLWVTNGTASGTVELAQFNSSGGISGGTGISLNESSVAVGGNTTSLNSTDNDLIVQIPMNISATLDKLSFITADANGGDTLTAGGAGQTLVGSTPTSGISRDTFIGASLGGDTFLGTSAQLNGETIASFLGSDIIDITNLSPSTFGIGLSTVGADTVLTLSDGTRTTAINLVGHFGAASFVHGADQNGGTVIGLTPFH